MRSALAYVRHINHILFHRNPIVANSVFYGILYGCSDVSQQLLFTPIAESAFVERILWEWEGDHEATSYAEAAYAASYVDDQNKLIKIADIGEEEESYTEKVVKDHTEESSGPVIKWDSVFRAWLMGTFFFGPCISTFVKIAHRLIPGSTMISAIKKVALDQVVMAFPMISGFFFGMSVLEGKSFEEFKIEWKEKFFPSWRAALCFWPGVQMFSWMKVSHLWRPRFLACCSFFWANFLCYTKQRPLIKVDATAVESLSPSD